MVLDLTNLHKAVNALEQIAERSCDDEFMAALDEIAQNAIRAGVIQHFEFTFELCWKFIQRWIRSNQTPEDADFPRTRKELFRMAAQCELISDPLPWFDYAEARNITSHTYDRETADTVYDAAIQFVEDAKGLLNQLEKYND